MSGQPGGLFPVTVVHCAFGCPEPVRALDPRAAHGQMEAHYAAVHAGLIAALTGPVVVCVLPGMRLRIL